MGGGVGGARGCDQPAKIGQFLLQAVVDGGELFAYLADQVGVHGDVTGPEERLERFKLGHQVTADLVEHRRESVCW